MNMEPCGGLHVACDFLHVGNLADFMMLKGDKGCLVRLCSDSPENVGRRCFLALLSS